MPDAAPAAGRGLPTTKSCGTRPWQQAEIGGFGTAVRNRDLDQDVFGVGLGVLHEYVEVTVFVENTCVE